jgi:hypothetical protein
MTTSAVRRTDKWDVVLNVVDHLMWAALLASLVATILVA